MIKAVIFDMDGTLLDSMQVWDHIGEQYLASFAITAPVDLQDILAPMSLIQSATYLKEQFQLAPSIVQIQKGLEQCVLHCYEQEVQLKHGVKECIDRCKEKGLRLCVLTASTIEMAQSAFTHCGIFDNFEFIMTCEEAGCPKTDARIYEKTIQKLGLQKQECLFIDDALYAISCMKQIGCRVYAVYDEANKAEWETLRAISDQSFSSLADWEVSL